MSLERYYGLYVKDRTKGHIYIYIYRAIKAGEGRHES